VSYQFNLAHKLKNKTLTTRKLKIRDKAQRKPAWRL